MNNSVILKYYLWKKKTILSYSKVIETLVSVNNNDIWKNKKEFDLLCKNIINEYVDKYLFNKDNITKDDGIDIEIKSKELNKIFLSISDYFNKINSLNRINDNKKETLLLTMIIYSASSLDKINSPYNQNIDYLETINKLFDDYNEMKLYKVNNNYEDKMIKLIELLRTNRLKERRMFELLENNNSYNRYINVSNNNNLFIASYNYYIKGLENFSDIEINKIFEKKCVYDDLCFISLDLIFSTILEEISIRKEISNYALVTYKNFYKKNKNLINLEKRMGNLKENISLLINYNDYITDLSLIDKVRSYGFKIIVDTHVLDKFNIQKIDDKDKILVNINNKDIKKENIIVLDNGESLSENELINIRIGKE
jgi:hypothetical protein